MRCSHTVWLEICARGAMAMYVWMCVYDSIWNRRVNLYNIYMENVGRKCVPTHTHFGYARLALLKGVSYNNTLRLRYDYTIYTNLIISQQVYLPLCAVSTYVSTRACKLTVLCTVYDARATGAIIYIRFVVHAFTYIGEMKGQLYPISSLGFHRE